MTTVAVTAADGFLLAAQVAGREHGHALVLLPRQANSHRWWTGLRVDGRPCRLGDPTMTADESRAHLLVSRIPDATLRLHPHGRHGFFEEFAAEVTPVVRDFLRVRREEARPRRE